MKVSVEYNKNRKSPYRVKAGNFYVYLQSRDEALRVKAFINRVLGGKQ